MRFDFAPRDEGTRIDPIIKKNHVRIKERTYSSAIKRNEIKFAKGFKKSTIKWK